MWFFSLVLGKNLSEALKYFACDGSIGPWPWLLRERYLSSLTSKSEIM